MRIVTRTSQPPRSLPQVLFKWNRRAWLVAVLAVIAGIFLHFAPMILIGCLLFMFCPLLDTTLEAIIQRKVDKARAIATSEETEAEQAKTRWLTGGSAARDYAALASCGVFKQPAKALVLTPEEALVQHALESVRPTHLDRVDRHRRDYEDMHAFVKGGPRPAITPNDYASRVVITTLARAAQAWLTDKQQQRMQQYHADGLVDPTAVTDEQREIIDNYRRSVMLLVARLADTHVSPEARAAAEATLAESAQHCHDELRKLADHLTRQADHELLAAVEVTRLSLPKPDAL